MTRLYFQDPYRTSFEARIIERRETPEGPSVVLDRTYFYPESGGQPFDLGTIDGVPVVKVFEDGETIRHVLQGMPARDDVACTIDADRRRDHMQQHCGQHLLSAAFLREAGAQTVSFHLGARSATIDLDRAPLGADLVRLAVGEANRIVGEARPVRSYFSDEPLELRKTPEVEGTLRIVEVEGFDRQACCGTHPHNTAEVGPILVRRFERFKSGTRVEFVCGARAIEDYQASVDRLQAVCRALGASELDGVAVAEKLVSERAALLKSHEALRAELMEARAPSYAALSEKLGARRVVACEVPDVSSAELRVLAHALAREPSTIALLGAQAEGRAHLVFARSGNLTEDMAALLRLALPAVEGRGGGNAQIAQGGGPGLDGLSAALDLARRELGRTM